MQTISGICFFAMIMPFYGVVGCPGWLGIEKVLHLRTNTEEMKRYRTKDGLAGLYHLTFNRQP
jgi:hypothetical protein